MMDDHLLGLALLVADNAAADAAINLQLLRLTAVFASSNIPSNTPLPPTPPDEKKLASSVNFDGGAVLRRVRQRIDPAEWKYGLLGAWGWAGSG